MSADVEYSVAAILQLSNEPQMLGGLARVSKAADKASERLKMIASGAAQGLGSVGGYVGDTIDHLGKMSAAAGAAGLAIGGAFAAREIKTGLVDVNAGLENARNEFATTFNMLNASDSFEGGLGLATDLIGHIREDSAALPGEFQDFVNMSQELTAPLINAGKGVKEIRDLTRQTAVAAGNIPFDVAAREMAMLLEGRAGVENKLGLKFGINTHTQVNGKNFNEATAAERFDFLQQRFAKADQSLAAYSNSWQGLTSTLSDYRKQFLGTMTEPLFNRAKLGMIDLVHYLDAHKSEVSHIATIVGTDLSNAYTAVEMRVRKLPEAMAYIRDHWTEIRGQVEGVAHTIEDGVHKAMVALAPAARFLGNELEHPARLLKEIVAIRLGAGALSAAPGMLNFGMNAAKLFGAEGGAAAGAAEGAAGAGAIPVLAAAGPALAAIAAIGVAIFDDVNGSASTAKVAVNDLVHAFEPLGPLADKSGLLRQTFGQVGSVLVMQLGSWADGFRSVTKAGGDLLSWLNTDLVPFISTGLGLGDLRVNFENVSDVVKTLGGRLVDVMNPLSAFTHTLERLGIKVDTFDPGDNAPIDHSTEGPSTLSILGNSSSNNPLAAPEKPKPAVTPAPVFNNAKFEIKIDARDQDPDRVIRRMFNKIGEVAAQKTARATAPGGA